MDAMKKRKPKVKRIVKIYSNSGIVEAKTEVSRLVLASTIAESIYIDMINRYDIETDDWFKDPDYVKRIWASMITKYIS